MVSTMAMGASIFLWKVVVIKKYPYPLVVEDRGDVTLNLASFS